MIKFNPSDEGGRIDVIVAWTGVGIVVSTTIASPRERQSCSYVSPDGLEAIADELKALAAEIRRRREAR